LATFIGAIIAVVLSVGLSAGLFIGTNQLIDRIMTAWPIAVAGLASLPGLLAGAILQHNGVVKIGGDPPLYAIGNGWLTIVLGAVVGAGIGYLVARPLEPSLERRTVLEAKWRPLTFVGPAVFFIAAGLILPSIRTAWLSLKFGTRGEGDFSLRHYRAIFGNDSFFNLDRVDKIFTSRLFIITVALVLVAALAAWLSSRRLAGGTVGRRAVAFDRWISLAFGLIAVLVVAGLIEGIARTPNRSWIYDEILTPLVSSPVTLIVLALAIVAFLGFWIISRDAHGQREPLDWGAPKSSTALVAAVILLLLAVFSTMQSTLWNNLWWVVTVTGLSVTLGLLLAILADRTKGEVAARTLIFLPMAISMVGAAVIWDFMYELQAVDEQTGLFNAILQGLGFEARGFFINANMIPWNNFWIMLILVWIQTGFAMVVLSSAIKGVPTELIEAARVDGATEVDVFWRVIIPQIRSTILVITTTLIIIVMKIFDLVKATTGGANRTNVLANEMFDQLRDRNFSLSSAFAVLIFGLTVPVMIINIRRSMREVGS
jgi:ABC-type sugar transport system permease subunit